MVKTAPLRSWRLAADDGAAHGLDKAAADRRGPGPCRPVSGPAPARDRICRRCARDRPLECRCPRPECDPQGRTFPPRSQANIGVARRIFRRVVEQIEQHLLEQHRVERQHRHVRRDFELYLVAPALSRLARSALPTMSPDRQIRDVALMAPDSSRVMSRRLEMNRLRRSASSWIVRDQFVLRGVVERACDSPAGSLPSRGSKPAASEIVGDRGQQGANAAARFRPVSRALSTSGREIDALDGERRLVGERIEQAALIGREQGARPVAVEADHADRTAAGTHRQEQALCTGQRVGAAAGRRGRSPSTIWPQPDRHRRACPPADSRRAQSTVRPRAAAGPRGPSASARSGRRSPRADRRASPRRRACG